MHTIIIMITMYMLHGQTYLWTVWYRTYLSKDVSPLKNWSRSMTFPIYSINGWWVMMSSVASRPWTMQSKYCYNTITTITTTTTRHINLNFIFIKWQKALTNSNFKMRYRCRAHWVCNLLIPDFQECESANYCVFRKKILNNLSAICFYWAEIYGLCQ